MTHLRRPEQDGTNCSSIPQLAGAGDLTPCPQGGRGEVQRKTRHSRVKPGQALSLSWGTAWECSPLLPAPRQGTVDPARIDPDASIKPKVREGLRLMPVFRCGEKQKWLGAHRAGGASPSPQLYVAVVSWTTGYCAPPSCSEGLS